MPANYVLIGEQTVSVPVSSVTLSNIPQTGYTDLKVVFSTRDTTSGTSNNIIIRLNSVTTSQSIRTLNGTGSAVASITDTPLYCPGSVGNTATANTFSNCEMYIPNYSSTTQNKSVSIDSVTENNATAAIAQLTAGLYASNSAITSIQFAPNGAVNFMAGSTFALYGIAAFGTTPTVLPKATGGDIVVNDGTYWYHAFLSSGVFMPSSALTADCLVIAGGGGGSSDGNGSAGGGGAGGLVYTSSTSFNSSNYAVTVGAGGIGSAYNGGSGNGTVGGSGTNSNITGSALSLTAAVGGGGGGNSRTGGAATSGGSGGGANCQTNTTGGAGTFGQGNAGGNSAVNSGGYFPSAGGGGAGAIGGAGVANLTGAGAGGAGLSTYSSWGLATLTGQNVSGTHWYAGGGGGAMYNQNNENGTGGAGGNGGGGTGGYTKNAPASSAGTNGTVNTGGGAGGSTNYTGQSSNNGGNGGSGIVIVRYTMA
jgi:hypothetical protein